MARGTIEISVWEPRAAVASQADLQRPRKLRSRWTASICASTLTFGMHLVAFTAMGWGVGDGQEKHRPDPQRSVGASGGEGGTEGSTLEWVQIDEDTVQSDSDAAESVVFAAPVLQRITPEVPDISLPRLEVQDDTQTGKSGSSEPGSSAMFGLYVGQMDARIERAWLRPRTAIGAPLFSCRVRIEQDEQGQVLDILPTECNGSDRWQQSLIQAIRVASPLPAPPDSHVFRRTVILSFHAEAYSATSDPYLYESPVTGNAQQSSASLPVSDPEPSDVEKADVAN